MGTLTGTYVRPDGSPADGHISFTLTARIANGSEVVVEGPVWAELDEDGSFSVELAPVDDPDWETHEGSLAYVVVEVISYTPRAAYWITPEGDGPWNIADLALYDQGPRITRGVAGPPGPAGPQGPTGSQGPQGDQGETGPAGTAATVTVGTTETGAPGSEAEVSNSGDENDAILDFVIPAGVQGPQGEQGEIGPQGEPGTIDRRTFNYVGSDGESDPGSGGIALEQAGNRIRALALSTTDNEGTPIGLGAVGEGDVILLSDDPESPPITGWVRLLIVAPGTDNGTWYQFQVEEMDSGGIAVPPDVGTSMRVTGTFGSGRVSWGSWVGSRDDLEAIDPEDLDPGTLYVVLEDVVPAGNFPS